MLREEVGDGPRHAGGRFLSELEVPRDESVVTLLGERPAQELLGGQETVHGEPRNGVAALDDHANGTVLPARPRSTDGLPHVRPPAPRDPGRDIGVGLLPRPRLSTLELRADVGNVGGRVAGRRTVEPPHLHERSGLVHRRAEPVLDDHGLSALEVVHRPMVPAPPADLEAVALRGGVRLGQVLSGQHRHRAGRLGQDALAHGESDRVRLTERVRELGHVELLRHLNAMVHELREDAAERGEVRSRVQDEHGPRPKRIDQLEVGAVDDQPPPTLPRVEPEPRVVAVGSVQLVCEHLDEVAQCANRHFCAKLGPALAVETPGALELIPSTLGPAAPHEPPDDRREVKAERASREHKERQCASADAWCCRLRERSAEDADEVRMVSCAFPPPTHRREPRRARRGGELQHLVEARQDVLVRDHQVEGREVAAVREKRRLRRDHHSRVARGLPLSKVGALSPVLAVSAEVLLRTVAALPEQPHPRVVRAVRFIPAGEEDGLARGERRSGEELGDLLRLGRGVHEECDTNWNSLRLPACHRPGAQSQAAVECLCHRPRLPHPEARVQDVGRVRRCVQEGGREVGDGGARLAERRPRRRGKACCRVCAVPWFSVPPHAGLRLPGEASEWSAVDGGPREQRVVDPFAELGVPCRYVDVVAGLDQPVPEGDQRLPDVRVRAEVGVEGQDDSPVEGPRGRLKLLDHPLPLPRVEARDGEEALA